MINLATQRLVFVAVKSNSLLPPSRLSAVRCRCKRRKCLGIVVVANSVRPVETQGLHEVQGGCSAMVSRGRCVTVGSV